MGRYPNQRTIVIHRNWENSNSFLMVDNEVWQNAAKDLNGNAFKIWMYLVNNQDKYVLGLSPQDLENRIGVKKGNSYISSIEELKKKGYLIGDKKLDFYAAPLREMKTDMSIGEFVSLEQEKQKEVYNILVEKEDKTVQEQGIVSFCSEHLVEVWNE